MSAGNAIRQSNKERLNMETLVFGILAVRNGYKQLEESFVPEPEKFQPFDLQGLGNVYQAKYDTSNRPSGRSPSLTAQVAS
jgi:hypothetical protein